ncbi:hypothetical protein [Rickettsia endosymbiont of Gonocerus acuteangulatus]|uniref:hypothetical protein n=1 Tax=Rickettsia endosymbiont of Gonocerus acuteangulatus TaxID=3066266 RepID=UPI003132BC68
MELEPEKRLSSRKLVAGSSIKRDKSSFLFVFFSGSCGQAYSTGQFKKISIIAGKS